MSKKKPPKPAVPVEEETKATAEVDVTADAQPVGEKIETNKRLDPVPEDTVAGLTDAVCPVCDGAGAAESQKGSAMICRCSACGLRFQHPRPALGYLTVARNIKFQNAMSRPHGREIQEQSFIAMEIMKGYHRHTSGRPAALNAFGKTVLDVNCELGLRLREFQKFGWTVQGIDTSKHAVEYARGCALDVREGWLDKTEYKANSFELIVFWENFGSLSEPRLAAQKLLVMIKANGLIFIRGKADPAMEQLFSFDQDALRRLMMTAGFRLVEEELDETGFLFWFGR